MTYAPLSRGSLVNLILSLVYVFLSAGLASYAATKKPLKHPSVIKTITKPKSTSHSTIPIVMPTDSVNKAITDGDSALAVRNYVSAISKYQSAVSISDAAKLSDLQQKSFAKLGNAYFLNKDYPNAIGSFIKAQASVQNPKSVENILNAKIWTALSYAYLANKDFEKADSSAASGLPLFDSLLADPANISTTPALAESAARLAFNGAAADGALKNDSGASAYLDQAFVYIDKAGQSGTLMEGDAHTALGSIYAGEERWSNAISQDNQALTIYTKLNNETGQKAALSQEASADQASEHFDKAVDAYTKLLSIFQTESDNDGQAQVALLIGVDCLRLKRFDAAKSAYTIAANASTKTGDKADIAKSYLGLGVALESLGDYTGAVNAFTSALPQYQAVGDNEDAGGLLLDLGGAYEQLSQSQLAVQAFNRAAACFTQAGDTKSASVASQKATSAVGNMMGGG